MRTTTLTGPADTEVSWRAAVAELGHIMTVWAHPDDESYLAGGVMAVAAASGARVTCVTATAGERGGPPDRHADTAWRRGEELSEALRHLGVDDHVLLGLPDGRCAAADPAQPVARLVDLLLDRRPDTVVTFGPDGLTGHADHRAVSRWVGAAVAGLPAPPRVLHAADTAEKVAATAHIAGIYERPPVVVPTEDLAVWLRLAGSPLDRKVAALRAHASQTRGLEDALGADAYRAIVAEEAFVSASGPKRP